MKRTPLQRRKGLQRGAKPLKRGKLKRQSSKQKGRLEEYYAQWPAFKAANPVCRICPAAGRPVPNECTERHHFAGRFGRLLTYIPWQIPSCRECRMFPHENPTLARAAGLLASAAQWGVYPI